MMMMMMMMMGYEGMWRNVWRKRSSRERGKERKVRGKEDAYIHMKVA
jgi:hypothetical protein